MGGHPHRRCTGGRERMADVAVQSPPDRQRQIGIDRLADQIVPKRQLPTDLAEHPGGTGLAQGREQLHRRAFRKACQVGQRQRRAEDRGQPQQLDGGLG